MRYICLVLVFFLFITVLHLLRSAQEHIFYLDEHKEYLEEHKERERENARRILVKKFGGMTSGMYSIREYFLYHLPYIALYNC